jgi:hypothetical protein
MILLFFTLWHEQRRIYWPVHDFPPFFRNNGTGCPLFELIVAQHLDLIAPIVAQKNPEAILV